MGMAQDELPDTLVECLLIVVGTVWPLPALFGMLVLLARATNRAARVRLERRVAEKRVAAARLPDPAAQLGLSEDDLDRLFAFQHHGDRWLLLARQDDEPRVARSDDREGLEAAYSFAWLRQRERGIAGEHQRTLRLLGSREIWPGSQEDGMTYRECRELPPIDAVRLRLRSATPGDWRFVPAADDPGRRELRGFRRAIIPYEPVENRDSVGVPIFAVESDAWGENAEANREFLVHARGDIERMLRELDRGYGGLSLEASKRPGLLVAADFLEERGEDLGAEAVRKLAVHGYVETKAYASRPYNDIDDSATQPDQREEPWIVGVRERLRRSSSGDWAWEARWDEGAWLLAARKTVTSGWRRDRGIQALVRGGGGSRPEDRPPPSVPLVRVAFDAWADHDRSDDDMRFIAHARTDAMRLLEELCTIRSTALNEDDRSALLRASRQLDGAGFSRESQLLNDLAISGVVWAVDSDWILEMQNRIRGS
ncbi:MAG TPA: hypothetical protein VGN57_11890 [Pirellulaceae bacterium]|jgi:hypothetical protein|nr:hypothetical protein [Pirellulaceae bacterium]